MFPHYTGNNLFGQADESPICLAVLYLSEHKIIFP